MKFQENFENFIAFYVSQFQEVADPLVAASSTSKIIEIVAIWLLLCSVVKCFVCKDNFGCGAW